MYLNKIKPSFKSKFSAKRVGRGIGSGLGKTAGRGHKGQKSRAGGYKKVGFEGGQMPIQRRLPKRGFKSLSNACTAEVSLSAVLSLGISEINLDILKSQGLFPQGVSKVKIITPVELSRQVFIKGLGATKAVRALIENAGGNLA